MEVVCENFRIHQKGSLQGFCDLVIEPPGVRVYSCELHRSRTSEWIVFPSRPYESGGRRLFARVIDLATRRAYDSFQLAAMEAIRRFRNEPHQPTASGEPDLQRGGAIEL